MPGGIPVATVALDGAKNAGILAAEIIGAFDKGVANTLDDYKKSLEEAVLNHDKLIKRNVWKGNETGDE